MVDNATYLKKEWFENKTKVGVTAGASAPEVLVREVLQTIQNWGHETIREGEGAEESIVFVLPKELRREGENKQILNKGGVCYLLYLNLRPSENFQTALSLFC